MSVLVRKLRLAGWHAGSINQFLLSTLKQRQQVGDSRWGTPEEKQKPYDMFILGISMSPSGMAGWHAGCADSSRKITLTHADLALAFESVSVRVTLPETFDFFFGGINCHSSYETCTKSRVKKLLVLL